MKILIIVCTDTLNNKNTIINLEDINNKTINTPGVTVCDMCLITSNNCELDYGSKISFKYKIVNPKKQLDKICDFIADYRSELNYDWYIKTRPDVKLFKPLDFNNMCDNSINARVRDYIGPKQVLCGASINLDKHKSYIYSEVEKKCILDDMIYVFHNNVIQLNAFDKLPLEYQDCKQAEGIHSKLWDSRNIKKNIITIYTRAKHHHSCNIPPTSLTDDIPTEVYLDDLK